MTEIRLEDSAERYFTIDRTCLKEVEYLELTDYSSIIHKSNDDWKEDGIIFSNAKSEIDEDNELLKDIKEYIVKEQRASTSLLQRKFRIGYSRAARLLDKLEEQGYVSAPDGSKPRDVLINR